MTITSNSSIRLTEQIQVTTPLFGQWVSGWVTSTQTDSHGVVFYGPFPSKSEAIAWASNLINAVVEPVYYPDTNAG
jgi:hypothetical protein